ncbi:MAG: SUMF1/EgtB/PvdO family nonheme iron enzyme [Planctomycetota bacterium]
MSYQAISSGWRKTIPAYVILIFIVLGGASLSAAPPSGTDYASSGGDANADGNVDIGDAIYLLNHLFTGGPAPAPCPPSGTQCSSSGGDANGDSLINIADGIWILAFLFEDGNAPLACPPAEPIEDPEVPDNFTSIGPNLQGYQEYLHDATGIIFVKIPSGNFHMGTTPEQEAPYEPGTDESPVHLVTLSSFLIAKTEIRQQIYTQVMGFNPAAHPGDNLPVEQVSWNDLSAPDGFLAQTGLSLPTEAQWEYACRGDSTGPFSGTGNLEEMGFYQNNSTGQTSEVGQLNVNSYGLHDMHGNVWEWVADSYSPGYYAEPCAAGLNPVNTAGLLERVVRGGAYNSTATTCRTTNRYFLLPLVITNDSVGFRPVFRLD